MLVIVGGGIVGLTTALAAERALPSSDILLLERSPELSPVGTGIVLWPNALAVLERLGVTAADVDRTGLRISLEGIRTHRGRWLRRIDQAEVHGRIGASAAFHRAELVDLLRSRLTRTQVQLGAQVTGVRPDGQVDWTQVGSDHTVTGEVVVAADGINSLVRTAYWNVAPVPSRVVCLRAVIQSPSSAALETWGRGAVCGHMPLPGDRTYVYAARRAPWDGRDLSWLASWPGELPRLADAVSRGIREGRVRPHVDVLARLPALPTFVHDRLALVGDAAHAMLPFLGQGACQGIEDAEALVDAVASGDLGRYDTARRRRAQSVARASRTASAVALADGLLAAVRDRAVPMVPDKAYLRQLAGWAAPAR